MTQDLKDYHLVATQADSQPAIEFWQSRLRLIGERNHVDRAPFGANHGKWTLAAEAQSVIDQLTDDEFAQFAIVQAALSLLSSQYYGCPHAIWLTPPLVDSETPDHSFDNPIPIIMGINPHATLRDFLSEIAEIMETSHEFRQFPVKALGQTEYRLDLDAETHGLIWSPSLHAPPTRELLMEGWHVEVKLSNPIQLIFSDPTGTVHRDFFSGIGGYLEQVILSFAHLEQELATLVLAESTEETSSVWPKIKTPSIPPGQTVVEAFEAQVTSNVSGIALQFEGETITYQVLNERANRLANHLRTTLDVGPDTLIPILMNRSDWLVVGILGVLKAGGAYVAIDPNYPEARRQAILEKADASLILTQIDFMFDLGDFAGEMIALDAQGDTISEQTHNPDERPQPKDLAYVIFTSGSTGVPKGCQLEHRNLVHYLNWALDTYFPSGAVCDMGLFTSISFDFTLTSLFCPLLRGDTLHIFSQTDEIDALMKAQFDAESPIRVAKLTPSHISILAQLDLANAKIETIISGGEALTPNHIKILRGINPDMRIIDEYGPTECTVGCIAKELGASSEPGMIGMPIADTQVTILNAQKQACPIGVAGEICVGGDGVFRGYHEDPELTSERIYTTEENIRFYHTGDQGRWTCNGEIEFLGRLDAQVKIRGHRIELTEIEDAIRSTEGIDDAHVMPVVDLRETPRLTAYYVAPNSDDQKALREELKQLLPDYMVPEFFVAVDAIPLTAHGKVDRKALPSPFEADLAGAKSLRQPHTPSQSKLADIWQETLLLKNIGLDDDFFERGGNSLNATQMVLKIWQEFSVQITVADIFEHPSIEALDVFIGQSAHAKAIPAPAPRAEGAQAGILSHAQERLWFLDQLDEDNTAYNIVNGVRLNGELQPTATQQALNALAQRHEALRTRFLSLEGKPHLQIDDHAELPVRHVDLRALPAPEQSRQIEDTVRKESTTPFNLSQAPLLRICVLQTAEAQSVLIITMHHIISDGWSLGILTRELLDAYEAFSTGTVPEWEALALQYGDYAAWQREWLEGPISDQQLSHWKKALAGAPPTMALPFDQPRPAEQTYSGAAELFEFPPDAVQRLKAMGQQSKTSLYMSMLGTFAALLSRYTRETDLVIGSPIANRHHPGTQSIIGFFVNTLALRLDLSDDPSLAELLDRTRTVTLQAFSNQDIPFERIVDALNPDRTLSHTPLFQVMFDLQTLEASSWDLPHLQIESLQLPVSTSKFDLTFVAEETSEGMNGSFEYNTDLFHQATIRQMAVTLRTLVERWTAEPDRPLSQISLHTETDHGWMIPSDLPMADFASGFAAPHLIFEHWAQHTPERPAVTCEDTTLSYKELNHRANQLAHALHEAGAGAGEIVGLSTDRSLDVAVGILGVLKAGGAYLPLDPAYPHERLETLLHDSGARYLVTRQHETLAWKKADATVLTIPDTASTEHQAAPQKNPVWSGNSDDLAYVIYTSGSTGRPKGVGVTHHNVLRLFDSTAAGFGFTSNDTWTLFHSYAFDFSVWELWGAFVYGGRLVITPYAISRSPDAFHQLVAREGVTVLNQTPSAFRQFIAADNEHTHGIPLQLRYVIFGGEALEYASLRPWITKHGDEQPQLVNMYGITETTVHVTYRRVRDGDLTLNRSFIGPPLADLSLYLVDSQLNPVPTGVPGELAVAGDGVARGYLGDEAKTNQKFVANPFGDAQRPRVYLSGDLARRLPTGELEYLGRIDDQVKIRGFRIEPAEIEARLSDEPNIREAKVIVREDVPGHPRLVAYVVATRGAVIEVSTLQQELRNKLPEHMVPAAIVTLETFPLTTNNKLDRQALPAPPSDRSGSASDFSPPSTGTEKLLAEIWQDLLRIPSVGIKDNFFELGGDSILIIQMVARAKSRGFPITPKQVFQHQSIERLAQLEPVQSEQVVDPTPEGRAPLTPIQHWFFEQHTDNDNHYNQSVLLVTPKDFDSVAATRALESVVAKHDVFRLRFLSTPDGWQQRYAPSDAPSSFVFETLTLPDVSEAKRSDVITAACERAQQGLDIENGPLIRVHHLRSASEDVSRLFFVIHHLAVDGVSWRILLEDFHREYEEARSTSSALQLPSVQTSTFHVWTRALNAYSQSATLNAERNLWLSWNQKSYTPLPIDFSSPRGPNTVTTEATFQSSLDEAQTKSLLLKAPAAYQTRIEDLLLTALACAFYDWTGNACLHIDLEKHGREEIAPQIDLSRTVGWFTAIFPFPIELTHPDDIIEALKSIKEQLRQIPRGGIGYGVLRYGTPGSKDQETFSSGPQPEVAFNYLGRIDESLNRKDGWTAAPESTGAERSPGLSRNHLLEINGMVLDGQLQFGWTYSSNYHREETIEALATTFTDKLNQLLSRCIAPGAGGFTPSDFPLARVTQAVLNNWLPQRAPLDTIEDVYPLSPMQQGMLFHQILAEDSEAYFTQLSCTITGPLERNHFKAAWQQAIDRHPILRTSFHWEGVDEPLQIVHRHARMDWLESDLSSETTDVIEQHWTATIEADRRRRFDVNKQPLLRAILEECGPDFYRFSFSQHHLLMDGWSLANVLGEVFDAYDKLSTGQKERPQPVRPYRDYIAWLQQQDQESAASYWTTLLKGFTTPTPLIRDYESQWDGQRDAKHFASVSQTLEKDLTQSLVDLSKQRKITLNILLQGMWAVLLHRYSGESDILFGATVSGRPPELEGFETMVGLFINTVPVRATVNGDQPLEDLLRALAKQQTERDHHSFCPLVKVQEWSEVRNDLPLFESLIVFENYPIGESMEKGVERLEVGDVRSSDPNSTPVSLIVAPGERLELAIDYDRDRFTAPCMEGMLRHLVNLLRSFAAEPNQTAGRLPLVGPEERHRLLTEWNQTDVAFDHDRSFIHRFEEQVIRTPDSIAVSFQGTDVSYRTLNTRINQLARHYLKQRNLKPDELVAVVTPRSDRMMQAIMAAWKCGAAYVPVDPSFPPQRILDLVRESGAVLIVTLQDAIPPELLEQLQDLAPCIILDTDQAAIETHEDSNLDRHIDSRSLAVVIFTSGSTGVPKGAMNTHLGMMNHFVMMVDEVGLSSQTVIAQTAAPCFDVSVWQFFNALIVGGKTVIYSYETVLEPQQLARNAISDQVTILQFVPSYLSVFLDSIKAQGCAQDFTRLEFLVVSGEVTSPALATRWFELFPDVTMVNVYGPAEASDDVTIHMMTEAPTSSIVPIGKAAHNFNLYILDPHGEPCPVGVAGEIVISGIGVGRGYLNNPEKTKAVFGTDPFPDTKGLPMYYTGDLGCRRADGNVLFIGRKDFQVKIRGIRIELDEIASRLSQLDGVQDSVVIVHEDDKQQKYLCAYIITDDDQSLTATGISDTLSTMLPRAMVPGSYVFLDKFPRTPNGKINRRALPLPKRELTGNQQHYAAPRDEIELQMIAIWESLLNRHPIGIHDDFFELGGHSLAAVQLMSRLQSAFGKTVPLSKLFATPTIERLARLFREDGQTGDWKSLVEIKKGGDKAPLYLIPGAGGNVLYFHHLASLLDTDQPVYGLQSLGLDGITKPLQSIEAMATHYLAEIRERQPRGPYLLGGHSFGSDIAFEMSRQLSEQGESVAMFFAFDSFAPVFQSEPIGQDWDDATWLLKVLADIEAFLGTDLSISYQELSPLSPEAQEALVMQRLKEAGWYPPDGDSALLRGFVQVYQANQQTHYLAESGLHHPIPTALFQTEESLTGETPDLKEGIPDTPTLAAIEALREDPQWGWGQLSDQPIKVVQIPGGHVSMFTPPHVSVLAAAVNECLKSATETPR